MRIIEANEQKRNRSYMGPSPLTNEMLDSKLGKINKLNFNWLKISVWFGLRPLEIDQLKLGGYCKFETLGNGREILWVYQTKIITLPPDQRWKPIPVLYPEQIKLIQVIKSKKFKRPIAKTMKRHFDFGMSLYGGRKGFTDLMLSYGHSLENISVWMGHATIHRTWRHYKQRKLFHLKDFFQDNKKAA